MTTDRELLKECRLAHCGDTIPCDRCQRIDAHLNAAPQPEILDALIAILPMAKGWAHEHPVGRNAQMIEEVEMLLSRIAEPAPARVAGDVAAISPADEVTAKEQSGAAPHTVEDGFGST